MKTVLLNFMHHETVLPIDLLVVARLIDSWRAWIYFSIFSISELSIKSLIYSPVNSLFFISINFVAYKWLSWVFLHKCMCTYTSTDILLNFVSFHVTLVPLTSFSKLLMRGITSWWHFLWMLCWWRVSHRSICLNFFLRVMMILRT